MPAIQRTAPTAFGAEEDAPTPTYPEVLQGGASKGFFVADGRQYHQYHRRHRHRHRHRHHQYLRHSCHHHHLTLICHWTQLSPDTHYLQRTTLRLSTQNLPQSMHDLRTHLAKSLNELSRSLSTRFQPSEQQRHHSPMMRQILADRELRIFVGTWNMHGKVRVYLAPPATYLLTYHDPLTYHDLLTYHVSM